MSGKVRPAKSHKVGSIADKDAQRVWEAFCGELVCFGDGEVPDDVKEALATALRTVHAASPEYLLRVADSLDGLPSLGRAERPRLPLCYPEESYHVLTPAYKTFLESGESIHKSFSTFLKEMVRVLKVDCYSDEKCIDYQILYTDEIENFCEELDCLST
jgi:hypothetical protein